MNYTRCVITSDNDDLITSLRNNKPENIMSVVCDYIMQENDRKIIKKYIKKNKLEIEAETFFYENIDKYFRRKSYLLSTVSEYLILNNRINIDGFIKFRLREYNRKLEKALLETKEEYFKYMEYLVFVEIIKEVIRNQNKMVNTLFIHIDSTCYKMFDDNNIFLNDKCIAVLKDEFNYEFDSPDEFLLSAVITLAPEKICVVNPEQITNRRLFETIKSIYRENYIT